MVQATEKAVEQMRRFLVCGQEQGFVQQSWSRPVQLRLLAWFKCMFRKGFCALLATYFGSALDQKISSK